ncbi:hypothetical protein AQ490_00940 [Wenjunlia vitaminophila]|uniref:Maltooligosyl trehalose synthase n=1 Tax=Wenjunlia vitaminophila TaxID=76728 RepID=A0A0T6LYU8_WENVI|nr:malto-oligosyltrehalose synthase [Wenjunlia vitaminophila]KRV51363.1 hypothetical protein AQ490_00940 [Wenjunlia vitaminophila]
MTTQPPLPGSTYRLPLQPDFPFAAAEAAVPHLASLGISHLHLPPVLQAAPGSPHGRDVVDHTRISVELGGERGLRSLAGTAAAHGMGLVVEVVPHHMAVPAPEHLNRPLWSVLREGPSSPYAHWFDIDWAAQRNRVLLPFLRDRLGAEVDRIERATWDGETILRYHDHAFPLRAGTEELPLPALVEQQWYRLAWWRVGRTELNYRRFLTSSGTIGLRTEDPEVFRATHGLLLGLVREGVISGLHVTHADGLADPRGYLRRLTEATARHRQRATTTTGTGSPVGAGEPAGRGPTAPHPVWTVVEKVLTGTERLPADWCCAGTTGREALHRVDGLFLCPVGLAELTTVYREFTATDPGEPHTSWTSTARRATREVLASELAAEVDRLTRLAYRICAQDLALRDHGAGSLHTAVTELLASFPTHRPYVVPGEPAPPGAVRALDRASENAGYAFVVAEEAAAVDVVRGLALGSLGRSPAKDEFVGRFAQVCAAVRATAVEGVAHHRWFPLLSRGEAGGDPAGPGTDPQEFHAFCSHLQRDWPGTGTVLSGHDTRRSADVRARAAVLSEVPRAWRSWLELASASHAHLRRGGVPDRAAEYLIWQTLLTAWDLEPPDRLVDAVRGSLREAGVHTGRTSQDRTYETAVLDFAMTVATRARGVAADFARWCAEPERANVLGAALVHLTMPGVPDVYQGTETLWHCLAEPDGLRPARFDELARALRRLDDGGPGAVPHGLGEEKLLVTATALRLRRARPEWFGADAGYTPVYAHGPAAVHAVAFLRAGSVLTVVTRLAHRLARNGGWRNTVLPLPDGNWTDLLTDRPVTGRAPLTELLDRHPVALLART